VPSVQWINSWWWSEELPETCRISCRSKFGKLVHLVGFIIKKFVTMHGHANVKKKTKYIGLIPMAARFKALVCGRSLAGIVSSNPAGAWMSVSCESCVLSGTVPCVGLITRLEETHRVCCVFYLHTIFHSRYYDWPQLLGQKWLTFFGLHNMVFSF